MDLASRLTRVPIAHDPERGREAAGLFPGLPPELRELIAGAAGSSPYLAGLIARERDWAEAALAGAPEAALDAELAALAAPGDEEAAGPALRRAKRRVALMAALADLGGAWTLEEVTGALTRLADAAVAAAVRLFVGAELRRGRIPGLDEGAVADAAGMVVFAMGKMGAFELNYSSDIDLICLFDETRFEPAEAHEARAAFIRATRKMTALLSDITAEGYVFRTDLRLRPDASVMPVCLGMEAAERYYEGVGRTWERAAWIKGRPCAGDLAGGERFLRVLSPFVWRRHLDFVAIQDAHDMRLRIRDHKGLHGRQLDGHDLKLGAGGIREIEFFTQTRQLIAGGRDPTLRVRGTVEWLARLADAGWIPAAVRDELTAHYRAHREVEHRLQMVADQQTHALPAAPADWDRLARLMGEGDTARLRAALAERLDRVAELTEGFFTPEAAREMPDLPPAMRAVVDRWRGYPALRSERAQAIFRRLGPQLLARLQKAAKPEEALMSLDGFLAGLPAGVQLFSLFEANPQLIDLIVDIAATAPALARYLSRNAGVLDAVIGGAFFAPWPGEAGLAGALADRLGQVADYERKLDAARVWAKEWHFRVGVHLLRGLIGAEEAGRQYADLAGAVVAALFPAVTADFAARHGPPPGRGAVVLGMGSLGAGALTAASDLDLIVIYDPAGQEMSEGRRPLAARAYYARLTQALVTALAAPMAEGKLYDVDMRLRPSGRQGPVATSFEAFRAYQSDEAWTWEHLALTRARVVADAGAEAAALGAEVEAFRRDLLAARGESVRTLADVAEMRARLFAAKPQDGPLDAKRGPGGMTDIELLAEAAALIAGSPRRAVAAQLAAGAAAGLLTRAEAQGLASGYRLLSAVQGVTRLLTEGRLDLAAVGEGGRAVLFRETGAAGEEDLVRRIAAVRGEALGAIGRVLAAAAPAGR
ncbi:MAG: glutamine-synthetase adenylyltransferase [Rhodobacteraceae bacterium]|nr:glutamine-synthetase adenylyltransferase [Paracoccaceae bacterium]